MKKILLIVALVISGMGLNAFNTNSLINDGNLSVTSILDEVPTDTVPTPKNFTADLDDFNTIVLKWDSVPNAYKYNVYRDSTLYIKVAKTTFTASSLEFGTEYCFSVSAVAKDSTGKDIESKRTTQSCETTAPPCPTPTGLKVKVEQNLPDYGKKFKITLTWDAVEGADLYAVYAATQFYPDPTWIGDAETNEFVQGSDAAGEFYLYVKTICDSDKKYASAISEGINAIFDDNAATDSVPAPENLVASAKSFSSIELTWNAVKEAKSYFVYYGDEEIANVKDTTYTVTNLKPNTEYCYTVVTMGVNEESAKSKEACATTAEESIEELASLFNIYPNPVGNELILTTEIQVEEISIYDVYGRQTMRQQVNETTSQQVVNVADLNSGVYFVKIMTNSGEVVKRFVKE